jgi:hypothetical protein
MMKLYFLLFTFFLTGCGAIFDSVKDDARFHPIRDQFVEDAKAFGVNVDITKVRISFGNIEQKHKFAGIVKVMSKYDTAEAYCLDVQQERNDILKPLIEITQPPVYRYKVIVVSDNLKNKNAEYLESVVYHELGHCVLELPHIESEKIMSSSGIESLGALRYFYLKEFFTHQPLEMNTILGMNKIGSNLEPFYQVDYMVFNQRIFYQLFYDSQINQFVYNSNPDLLKN